MRSLVLFLTAGFLATGFLWNAGEVNGLWERSIMDFADGV